MTRVLARLASLLSSDVFLGTAVCCTLGILTFRLVLPLMLPRQAWAMSTVKVPELLQRASFLPGLSGLKTNTSETIQSSAWNIREALCQDLTQLHKPQIILAARFFNFFFFLTFGSLENIFFFIDFTYQPQFTLPFSCSPPHTHLPIPTHPIHSSKSEYKTSPIGSLQSPVHSVEAGPNPFLQHQC